MGMWKKFTRHISICSLKFWININNSDYHLAIKIENSL